MNSSKISDIMQSLISNFSQELQNNKKEDLGTYTGGHGALSGNWWTVSFCCHHVFVFLVTVPKNWQQTKACLFGSFKKKKKRWKVSRQRGSLAFLLRSLNLWTVTAVQPVHQFIQLGTSWLSRVMKGIQEWSAKAPIPVLHCWRLTVSHSFWYFIRFCGSTCWIWSYLLFEKLLLISHLICFCRYSFKYVQICVRMKLQMYPWFFSCQLIQIITTPTLFKMFEGRSLKTWLAQPAPIFNVFRGLCLQ